MDIQLKLSLIKQAQKHLVANPQDPMHDVTHHYRVAQLAKQLIEAEGLAGQVDEDLVEVLCWWHDVQVEGLEHPADRRIVDVTADYLVTLLPPELQERAHDSMVNHEFGSKPNFIEGQILQDADKLEILSEARVDCGVENIRAGVLDRDEMLRTLAGVKAEWLPKMVERYHFSFSKNYHQQRIIPFAAYLDAAEATIRKMDLPAVH